MVEARIPARITPAMIAKKAPFWLTVRAMTTMIRCEFAMSRSSAPLFTAAQPMIPIRIATAIEIVTHTVAIRREVFSFFASSIAMKRSRMWGIPK